MTQARARAHGSLLLTLLLPAGALAGDYYCAAWNRLTPAERDSWLERSDAGWNEAGELCLQALADGRAARRASLDRACEGAGVSDAALDELLEQRPPPCVEAAEREASRRQRAIDAALDERARARRAEGETELTGHQAEAIRRQDETICRGRAAQVAVVDPGPYPTPAPSAPDLGAAATRGLAWGAALGSNARRQRDAFEGCMAERGWMRER